MPRTLPALLAVLVISTGAASAPGAEIPETSDPVPAPDSSLRSARCDTGTSSFEPTVGITRGGALFTSSLHYVTVSSGAGVTIRRHAEPDVYRSLDACRTWRDVSPTLANVLAPPTSAAEAAQLPPITNDPYVHVDPDPGRVFTIDLLGAVCSWLSWSDDLGERWSTNPLGCGQPPGLQDHQTLFTARPRSTPTNGYANLVYYCVNQVIRSACATSADGGKTFGQLTTVYEGVSIGEPDAACLADSAHDVAVETVDRFRNDPTDTSNVGPLIWYPATAYSTCVSPNDLCGGLHGHGAAAPDGVVYLPRAWCGHPYVARSVDDGAHWTPLPVSLEDRADDPHIEAAVDEAGNVYALWNSGRDGLPRWSVSRDQGETWSPARKIAPPDLEDAVMPTIAAGAEGRIAVSFIGRELDAPRTWHAYLAVVLDAASDAPRVQIERVNPLADPIARDPCDATLPSVACQYGLSGATGDDCYAVAKFCGIGDFLDIQIDAAGRPWAAFVDVCNDTCATGGPNQGNSGFLATAAEGPALRGPPGPLAPLDTLGHAKRL